MNKKLSFLCIFLTILSVCYGQDENASTIFKDAMAGDAKSQYIVATYYYNGCNQYKKDYYEAVKWTIRSALQGFSEAQNLLGYCYFNGQGVQQDYKHAVYWYTQAANQGNTNAQHNLAICYENGKGVPVNMQIALEWYKTSARKGDMNSQYIYAKHLMSGHYVEKDSVEACFWLYYSARGGNDFFKARVDCNKKADILLKKMADNNQSFIIAYAKYYYGKLCRDFYEYLDAEKYFQESYVLGCYDAAMDLGYIYYNCDYAGGSIRTNTNDDMSLKKSRNADSAEEQFRNRIHKYINDNAEYWFNEAIYRELENSDWLYWHLCNIYTDRGEYKKAAIYLEQFLSKGHCFQGPCEDYLRLADLYFLSDYKTDVAFQLYKERYEAIETKSDSELNDRTWYSWIVCGLGKCYYTGKGVSKSYEKAVKFLNLAAEEEDAEALQILSRCYRFGRGVPKNITLANTLLKKSESLKDPTAMRIQALLE